MNTISQCPCCMEKHALKKISLNETTVFKDETVEYIAEYYYCKNADETYADEDQISSNDISMKNAYRIKMGLLTSIQIADIRRKYNISQSDLCTLLGWGGKTVTRYESHQVQDIAHDTILRKLDKDPEWFLELLDKSQSSLSKSSYNKCKKAGIILFEQFHDHLLRTAIMAEYLRYLNDLGAKDDFEKFLDKNLKNEDFRKEWEALEPEYAIMKALIDARTSQGLTQKELSVRSGIAQGDISKIENGNANPSIKTLQRLAQAMGKNLKIEFIDSGSDTVKPA